MTNHDVTRRQAMRRAALGMTAGIWALATGCSNDSAADRAASPGEPESATTDSPVTSSPVTVDVASEDFEDRSGVDTVDISVVDNSFEPRWVIVSAGSTVRWTNNGRNHHNIVAEPEGTFVGIDHEQFPNGSVHTVTFGEPGDFAYFCSLHGTPRNGQNGVIRVVD
ncbi:MAG: hypothetical protein GX868_01055 [Actinobacteria bacterium]|nr:hypothetical protein [Actinomycetota bacterium]